MTGNYKLTYYGMLSFFISSEKISINCITVAHFLLLSAGTLRMNLDPFSQYPDEELWNALERTNLKSYVQTLEGELEYVCSEGGENLRY